MSTMSSAQTSAQRLSAMPWTARLLAKLDRWWTAYLTWRVQQAAIRQLEAMGDRELRDMGITRGEIEHVVGNELPRERAPRHYRWSVPGEKARRP